ncbi:MAG TPA: diaminopimelate epimerase, partial [Fimbriimonadaceae bacterium]|nr:diaminopimelate epimerase [Fimbriimonadaceae bacterium]
MLLGAPLGLSVVPFTKVESVGNDFVLIEEGTIPPRDLAAFAIHACRRRYSVGADGLLVVGREGEGVSLRMFNPDGSEDFCGNGLRCAAAYARRAAWVGYAFTIRHLGRTVPASVDGSRVRTLIAPASFAPDAVPHTAETEIFLKQEIISGHRITMSALSTGSTHVVLFVDSLPIDDIFQRVSSTLEHHPLFPERTSVIWVQPVSENHVRIRIWERGAGETLGCGTGSAAAAAAFFRRAERGGELEVLNPGGPLKVRMDSWDSLIEIEGTPEILYRGELSWHSGT